MSVSVMWKTVSEACNLACDYCYYSRCAGQPHKVQQIDPGMLEKFIKDYMAYVHQTDGVAVFAWQGGEPLLAGIDFFREVVRLQARYAWPNTVISNSVQTNGTLITDEWARFFKKYKFLLGVSLDGPQHIHDARRVDHAGHGSYERVMRGVAHLNRHQVEYNVLTVVHQGNVHHVEELMDFYLEHRFAWLQFIPAMEFKAQNIEQEPTYEITSAEYGKFLCDVFDRWIGDGEPKFSVRLFDSVLSLHMNRKAGYCILGETCDKSLVLELNGDAYPCDFHIHEDWKLGNVGRNTVRELLQSEKMRQFLTMKPTLPKACRQCRWNAVCHGGCPRNRRVLDTGELGTDIFCAAYKQFFAYSETRMTNLALRTRRRLFEAGMETHREIGRNELCPCGSGQRYKNCCQPFYESGWKEARCLF